MQIYEDSIVIKSVFESARQRIVTDVTDEEQKETVSAGHSDNGGGAEDQFVPSAGESQNRASIKFLGTMTIPIRDQKILISNKLTD